MIDGKAVSFSYEKETKNKTLDNISFEITKNRITTFMGKSGTGKTTLLKCLANLNNNYEGTITCDNFNTKEWSNQERATNIGFVFQQFHLFPHITVLQNCTQPLKTVLGYCEKQATEVAHKILISLEMDSYKNTYPEKLSGGQQQKIAIARSLCLNPKVMVFDEPTSSLDPESTKQIQDLLLKLKNMGITIAISSHDMPFIKGILDRVYFLESGKIVDFFDEQHDKINEKNKISEFLNH